MASSLYYFPPHSKKLVLPPFTTWEIPIPIYFNDPCFIYIPQTTHPNFIFITNPTNMFTMAKLRSLLQLVLVILFTPSLCCPEDQKQALLHFKASFLNATGYFALRSPSYMLETWNSSSDCCRWERVNCTSPFGSKIVITLDLSVIVDWNTEEPTELTFTIFTLLFRIRSLTKLDLSVNLIQGGELLGDSLANLSKLVHLDLSGNSFHGNIPKEIGNMTKL